MEQKVKDAVDGYIGKDPLFHDDLKERIISNNRVQMKNTKKKKKCKRFSSSFKPVIITFLLIFGSVSYYFLSTLPEEENGVNGLPNNDSLVPDDESLNKDEPVWNSEKENDTAIERELLEESADIIETEKELLALSEEIFSLLKESNYEKIAEKVDPEHGVTFAFYADFGHPNGYGGEYVNLPKKDISKENNTKYLWGADESGRKFEMSLDEYVQQFLLRRWGMKDVDYSIVTYNEPAENFAGVFNTIHENYPDAKYVEYYMPGETEHLFQSLRFVYQERDGEWYLIGLVRDVATV